MHNEPLLSDHLSSCLCMPGCVCPLFVQRVCVCVHLSLEHRREIDASSVLQSSQQQLSLKANFHHRYCFVAGICGLILPSRADLTIELLILKKKKKILLLGCFAWFNVELTSRVRRWCTVTAVCLWSWSQSLKLR